MQMERIPESWSSHFKSPVAIEMSLVTRNLQEVLGYIAPNCQESVGLESV